METSCLQKTSQWDLNTFNCSGMFCFSSNNSTFRSGETKKHNCFHNESGGTALSSFISKTTTKNIQVLKQSQARFGKKSDRDSKCSKARLYKWLKSQGIKGQHRPTKLYGCQLTHLNNLGFQLENSNRRKHRQLLAKLFSQAANFLGSKSASFMAASPIFSASDMEPTTWGVDVVRSALKLGKQIVVM